MAWYWQEKTEALEGTVLPTPRYPPQTLHRVAWDLHRAFAVRGWQCIIIIYIMFGAKSLTTLLTCTCVVSHATMIVNHTKKFVSRSDCDYSQCTNQHLQRPATKPWKPSPGSANCLTRQFIMYTEVTEQNVHYLIHVYNISVRGKFRWNFTKRIFCGYAYFHMNHLKGQIPYWEFNSQLVVKDISCLLWNLNVHYNNYKSQAKYPIWSLMNAVHIFIYDFFQISFNSVSYQCLSFASGVLPVGLPDELQYTLFIVPMSVNMSHPLHLSLNHAN